MKFGSVICSLVVATACTGHAKLVVSVPIAAKPTPPSPKPEPKPVPKPEPPAVVVADATVTGAQLDVPGSIEFERDKASLRHAGRGTEDTLSSVLAILQKNPSITKLRIEGHTDADGDDHFNQTLSEGRAKVVVKWLVAKGVAAERLVAVGCAARDPLVPNTTDHNKQMNRRTEFDIEGLDGSRPTDYTAPCEPNPKRKSAMVHASESEP